MEFDRNVTVNGVGIPACRRAQIEFLGGAQACRGSIIGRGNAHIGIESRVDPLYLPLTLYKGVAGGGAQARVLIRAAVPTPPGVPSVAVVELRKIKQARYGWEAIATIPEIAGGDGTLLDFSLKLNRLVAGDEGARVYAMARCPDERLQAEMRLTFVGSEIVVGKVVSACARRDEGRWHRLTAR